jgi:hypothetical protein
MTKEYNRFYEDITSTECYGGFPKSKYPSFILKAFSNVANIFRTKVCVMPALA